MRRGFKALTFVEVLVTMSLLLLFAALAYPVLYGVTKGYQAHRSANSALEARLSLTTRLAKLSSEILPPYWENMDSVFLHDGASWTARYWQGDPDKALVLSFDAPGRLRIVTPDGTLIFDHLPAIIVDWWKKDGRILGWQLQWQQDAPTFHTAWGTQLW